jgi:hypothetical protein
MSNDSAVSGGLPAWCRLLAIVLVALASLVLAACGGGDSDNASDENGSGDTQDASPNQNGDAVGTEEFGMTDEELVTAIEEVEASIATCMNAAGFEYIPIDPVTFRDAMDSLTAVPGLTDEEFVDQYGFGLTTLPPTQAFGAGPENQAIVDALSPADQVAYMRTLLGDDNDATFVIMLENEDFQPAGGCTLAAIEEVFSEEQLNPNFTNPFDQLVAQDPRMIDAFAAWSDCMSEAGYDYENEEDIEEELLERLDSVSGGADPATLEGAAKDELAALQAEERAVALEAFDCFEEHVDEVELRVERDVSGRN